MIRTVCCAFLLSFAAAAPADDAEAPSVTVQETGVAADALTAAELRAMVETAVSQKLRPLERELVDLREQTRLHDIIGGIGYIFGIAGIAFYFLGARRRDSYDREQGKKA